MSLSILPKIEWYLVFMNNLGTAGVLFFIITKASLEPQVLAGVFLRQIKNTAYAVLFLPFLHHISYLFNKRQSA